MAKRYNEEERAGLLEKFDALRKNGATAYEAAEQCGVPYITLHLWERKASGNPYKKGVRAEKNKFIGKVVVTFANGSTLECETLVDFKKILPNLK